MSLRLRLALILAAVFAGLAALGGFGLHRLADGLQLAMAEGASEAGQRVVRVLSERIEQVQLSREAAAGEERPSVRIVVNGRELSPEETADHPLLTEARGSGALMFRHEPGGEAGAPASRIEVRALSLAGGEPSLWVSADGVGQAIPLPRSGLERELGRFTQRLAWGLLALMALGLALSIWLAHRVTSPLRELAGGAARLGAGERGVRVADGGVREVRETIAAFNRMAGELERLDAEALRLRGQQALAELGEIGRGLAHSLRNPLHALGLCVEALQAQARSPDEAANLARTAREQIARLDGSLRGFLALSAGVDAPTARVRLREVIEDVLLEARQSFGPRIAFEVGGDLDAELLAVAVELRILLHSLVTNAAEASPDGGRVVIAVEAGDPLQLSVTDEGPGVPGSLRPRLFQPHVSSKPQGAGMGLYLAQRLAALRYRGEIALDDREGGGTLAMLRLHARQSA